MAPSGSSEVTTAGARDAVASWPPTPVKRLGGSDERNLAWFAPTEAA
jgi:hypothetical protein